MNSAERGFRLKERIPFSEWAPMSAPRSEGTGRERWVPAFRRLKASADTSRGHEFF